MNDTLHVFWEFSTNTPATDLPMFLAVADLARRRSGHDRCHIVLCDLASEHQADNVDEELEWRIWNQFIPTLWSLPACQSFSVCRCTEEVHDAVTQAGVHVFPPHLDQATPPMTSQPQRTGTFWLPALAAAASANIAVQPLRATQQALEYVRQWLDVHAKGRMVIALSLDATEGGQPSNLWANFASSLDPEHFLPVVLPGPRAAHLTLGANWGSPVVYAEATWNMELRMALYEESDLVLLDDTVGAPLALFGAATRCIAFGNELPALPKLPETQRVVRIAPTAEVLESEYRRMAVTLAFPLLREKASAR